jgi:hypothetical protein
MARLFKVGLSLLLLAFVLIGVSYGMLRAQGIHTPGSAAGREMGSEGRSIGRGITEVELSGPIDLKLTHGEDPVLRVRGEQRLLANVDTRQEGGVLHIGIKGMLFHHRNPLEVEVRLPELAGLTVRGSGDTSVSGFSGPAISMQLFGSGNVNFNGRYRRIAGVMRGSGDLKINGGNSESVELDLIGSGQMTATGSTAALTANLTGSGDLDAEHLAANTLKLVLQGSGSADVFARDEVDLVLRGSGDIRVYGNPEQRKVSRSGSGEVKWE